MDNNSGARPVSNAACAPFNNNIIRNKAIIVLIINW